MISKLAFQKRLFSHGLKFPTQLLINNQWVNSQSGNTFATINPATEEEICQVQEGGEADVDLAVKAARKALKSGPWAEWNMWERQAFIHRFADNMAKNAKELATLESLDNGKPYAHAFGEVMKSVYITKYYAGYTDKMHGKTFPMLPGQFAYSKSHPVGVCGQITPWNYPFLMAIFKIAPVLASGCTTVLKPAENTPLTALRIGEILVESGMPEGVVNIIPGMGPVAGEALVRHHDVDKIAFTGSGVVGKRITREASHTLKRVSLELGGKSPNIILNDADIDFAVAQSNGACFVNAGQICLAGSRVFVQSGIYDQYVEKIVEAAKAKKIGDPLSEANALGNMGPLISQVQMDKVLNYINIGKQEGATLLCGGNRLDRKGYFVDPAVFVDVSDEMTIAKEEIFGPVMCIMKFDTIEEVLERANNTRYGLASGVVTQNLDNAIKLSNGLEAGMVYVNNWGEHGPTTPFGGFKESGIGRELGEVSLDGYLEKKTVVIKHK